MSVITRPCETCGTVFTAWDYPTRPARRFCSRQCWLKVHNNPERNAEVGRGSAVKVRAHQPTLGQSNGRTYAKLHGRHEHRRVAEQKLGRLLRSDEIVHHLDGDKRNNTPENLQVLTRREHILEHLPAMHAANRAKRGGAL